MQRLTCRSRASSTSRSLRSEPPRPRNTRHRGARLRLATLAAPLLALAAPLLTATARSAELRPAGSENPLQAYGWIRFTQHYTDATGNTLGLRRGTDRWRIGANSDLRSSLILDGHLAPALRVDGSFLYDSRYGRDPYRTWDRTYWDHFRMKLALDSDRPVWGQWNLKGRLNLDRDPNWRNRYPDSRLLMEPLDELRLEGALELSAPWARVRAGDTQARLGPTPLTLYERNAFGLHGDLRSDNTELQFIGARAKGEVFYQTPADSLGLRADGTSGPYRLAHAPIVRGSETVFLEVRDRFDPTIVRERTPQRRLIDYTVDYARGVLTFMQPVPSEDFEDRPIYIAVQYSYDARDDGSARYLAGSRAAVRVGTPATVGLTWAGEFDRTDSRGGDPQRRDPLRHHVYGFDLALSPLDGTELKVAAAGSDTGSVGDDRRSGALAVELDSRSTQVVRLKGSYQRLEDRFDPISNRFLVGQRDREQLEARAEVAVSPRVRGWFGERAARDLRRDADGGRAADWSHLAGAAWTPGPELTAELELRDQTDGRNRAVRDDRRQTGRLGLRQTFGSFDLAVRYEGERFDERARADGRREALHRFKLAPVWNLGAGLKAGAEAKSELTRDRRADRYRDRRDFAGLRLDYRPGARLSALAAAERRTDVSLSRRFSFTGGEERQRSTGWSLGADCRPSARLRTLARLEGQRTRDRGGREQRRSTTVRHEIFLDPTADLELHTEIVHADLADRQKIGVSGSGRHRLDNEVLVEGRYNRAEATALSTGFHWHARRAYRADRVDTRTRRVFAGVTHRFAPRLEGVAEIDYAWLRGEPAGRADGDPLVDHAHLRWSGELAWDIADRARVALGHARVDYRDEIDPADEQDYAAGRTYLKLMGRF